MKKFLVIDDEGKALDKDGDSGVPDLLDSEASVIEVIKRYAEYNSLDLEELTEMRVFEVVASYAYVPPKDHGSLVKKDK